MLFHAGTVAREHLNNRPAHVRTYYVMLRQSYIINDGLYMSSKWVQVDRRCLSRVRTSGTLPIEFQNISQMKPKRLYDIASQVRHRYGSCGHYKHKRGSLWCLSSRSFNSSRSSKLFRKVVRFTYIYSCTIFIYYISSIKER